MQMLEAFLPTMIQRNHGHVVALSSMAGVMGIPNLVPYCGSKYAVRGLMEALSEELREDARQIDVQFTSIFPFIVDTGLCKKPRTRYHHSRVRNAPLTHFVLRRSGGLQ